MGPSAGRRRFRAPTGICALDRICLIEHNFSVAKAEKIHGFRITLPTGELVEVSVHRLPMPIPPCSHDYRYRMVMIRERVRVVGYDNERGKGDHRHLNGVETRYHFRGLAELFADFKADVKRETE